MEWLTKKKMERRDLKHQEYWLKISKPKKLLERCLKGNISPQKSKRQINYLPLQRRYNKITQWIDSLQTSAPMLLKGWIVEPSLVIPSRLVDSSLIVISLLTFLQYYGLILHHPKFKLKWADMQTAAGPEFRALCRTKAVWITFSEPKEFHHWTFNREYWAIAGCWLVSQLSLREKIVWVKSL